MKCIHAHVVATSGYKLKWLADDGEVRARNTIKSPGKQNARKTEYPVFHMLFVKTILMCCYGVSVCIIDRYPATVHFEINSHRLRRRWLGFGVQF